ncbi:MAG TPA: hypothetical protein VF553_19035 [Pyrinomonadaceae bacterium]
MSTTGESQRGCAQNPIGPAWGRARRAAFEPVKACARVIGIIARS